MKKWIYILPTFALLFCSCVFWRYSIRLDGRVLSNINEEPIKNAQVTLNCRNVTVATDSLGFFNLHVVGGGSRRSAPQRLFTISKEGYKDFRIRIEPNRRGRESVYTVKRGRVPYTFGGKRFYPDSTNLSTWIGITHFEKYSRDFSVRNNSFTFFMDIDCPIADLELFLKHREPGWKIK